MMLETFVAEDTLTPTEGAILMYLQGIIILLVTAWAGGQTTVSEAGIPALLQQVMHNQRELNKQITEYTATSKQTRRAFDDKGKLQDELVLESESYQSSQRNVEVVLRKNGKPLSDGKIEKERKNAVKALTEDEIKRLAEASTTADKPGSEFGVNYGLDKKRVVRLGTFEVFRSCALPIRAAPNGRDVQCLCWIFARAPIFNHRNGNSLRSDI